MCAYLRQCCFHQKWWSHAVSGLDLREKALSGVRTRSDHLKKCLKLPWNAADLWKTFLDTYAMTLTEMVGVLLAKYRFKYNESKILNKRIKKV